jgi:hypothetical protein
MELESIFDSQIHCRLNSAQSSTTQDSCMGTLGPWGDSDLQSPSRNVEWLLFNCSVRRAFPSMGKSTLYIKLQKLHRGHILLTNKEAHCLSHSWVPSLRIVMIFLPAPLCGGDERTEHSSHWMRGCHGWACNTLIYFQHWKFHRKQNCYFSTHRPLELSKIRYVTSPFSKINFCQSWTLSSILDIFPKMPWSEESPMWEGQKQLSSV